MADLTPDEAITKLRTLPEDQQRAVLEKLSPDVRSGIMTKLKAAPGAPATPGKRPAPGNPRDDLTAVPAFWSKRGLREFGYRAVHGILDAFPTAGGVAGGIAGAGAGVESGPGAIATAAAGATAGGVLGEDLKLPLERKIFPASKGWGPGPTTAADVAKDLAKEGAIQGLSEATGRLGSMAMSPIAKYFGDTAIASARSGVKLLPSEAKGGAESYIEKFLKGSVLTSGKMEKFRVLQNAQTRQAAEAVADQLSNFSGTPEAAGKLVQDGLKKYTAAFRAQQNQMYGDIDKAVQEKMVYTPVKKTVGKGFMQQTKTVMQGELQGPAMPSMAPLKKFASEQLARLNQQEKVMDPALLSSSRSFLENVMKAPEKVPFGAMADSRSDMLALSRKLDEALPGKQAGFAKKLAQLADQSMMDAADQSGIPGLSDAVRNANDLTRETHEMFEQQLVKKVVASKRPEVISKLIAGNAVGNEETRNLMTMLPDTVKPVVRKQLMMDAFQQSIDKESGYFNERAFAKNVLKLGDERGEIVYGKNWSNVKDLAGIMGKINGPTGITGGSGAALQNFSVLKNFLLTVAGPFGLAGAHHPLAAAGSIGGEYAALNILASATTNPETAAKVVKAARVAARGTPYAAVGGYEVAKGQTKVTRDLQAIREKHASQLTTPGP